MLLDVLYVLLFWLEKIEFFIEIGKFFYFWYDCVCYLDYFSVENKIIYLFIEDIDLYILVICFVYVGCGVLVLIRVR